MFLELTPQATKPFHPLMMIDCSPWGKDQPKPYNGAP